MTCDQLPARRPLTIAVHTKPATANYINTPPSSELAPPTCPICCCAYTLGLRRPKLLPRCGHTFCAPCLETLGVGSVKCPLCRRSNAIDDCRLLGDDPFTLGQMLTLQAGQRLYPSLSPLKPPPAYQHDELLLRMPPTPVKTRADSSEIPTSVLRPPAWNPNFTNEATAVVSTARGRKRTATSPRSRLSKPYATKDSSVPVTNTRKCTDCGYEGAHSTVKCAASKVGFREGNQALSDAYFTAPDEFYTTCTATSDEITSSDESLDNDVDSPIDDSRGSAIVNTVRRTNSLPSAKHRGTFKSLRTRNLSAPIAHMARLGKQLRRGSDGDHSNSTGYHAGELCALKLIRTMGSFSLSPNTPGSFRRPTHITVSRYNGHVAVIDNIYSTVQVGKNIFNSDGTKSLNMIDIEGVTSSCFVSDDTIVCGNHLGLIVYTYTSNPVYQKRQIALSRVISMSPYHGDAHEGAFIAVQAKAITVFSGSKLRILIQLYRRIYPKRVFRKQIAFRSLVDCSSTRSGDLVALDSRSSKLYLMDRHGRVIFSIDSHKELCGRFNDPISVTSDHFNDIYVCDKDRVLKFSAEGLFSRAMLRVTGQLLPMAISSCLVDENDPLHSNSHLLVTMYGLQKSQALIRVYSI